MSATTWGLFGVLAYLCGSVPFGLVLTRWLAGKDVRAAGSGNIGATNVARVAGKKLAVLVLLLDAFKGAAPVLLARWLYPQDQPLHAVAAFVAVLGHVFPLWLRFRGGKGVATALGGLAVLVPWAALGGLLAYALMVALFRVSSLGSLVGALCAVVIGVLVHPPAAYGLLALALFVLLVLTHRANISRLLRRAERSV